MEKEVNRLKYNRPPFKPLKRRKGGFSIFTFLSFVFKGTHSASLLFCDNGGAPCENSSISVKLS